MLRSIIVIINNKAHYIGEARNNEDALFSVESYTRTNFIGNTNNITQIETHPDKEFIFVVNSTLYEWVES
jgi:hypothetical protein